MERDSLDRDRNLIAAQLRLARESTGIPGRVFLSQDALVEKLPFELGFTRETIAKIENLDRGVKDYELVELADALSVGIEWLLGRSNEGGPQ